jgi:hypothetical protein
VEVADEPVAECAQGLVVGVADGAVLVVELALTSAITRTLARNWLPNDLEPEPNTL